jgi:DMSO/TMAO reductase YedYZ heme-binding membrane subunit
MLLGNIGPSALWYLTRATGAVCLLLLTVSVALGVANVGRLQTPGWPRFVIEGIHRNASLLALVVLLIHIVTSLLDPFAGIKLIDAVVPFTGSYRPLWLGLGAFASDLLIAVALTSVVRRRLGHGIWRAVHWLAYLCWPVALVHAAGTGSDIRQTWMLALTAVCVLAVIAAVWVRISVGWPNHRGLRGAALAASIVLPATFLIWLPGGPLAKDWARRAGTPLKDLVSASVTTANARGGSQSTQSQTGSSAAQPPGPTTPFSATVNGTTSQSQGASGLVTVTIAVTVSGSQLGVLDVHIYGNATAGGGVEMTSSSVSLGTSGDPSLYGGVVTALDGTDIVARVGSSGRSALTLALDLQIDAASGATTGTVHVSPA